MPVAAIVAVPAGNVTQVTVWSIPALGLAVTITEAVSVQEPSFHINLYVPTALKSVIVVFEVLLAVIIAVPGLPVCSVHVPIPSAAIVAVPLGNDVKQVTVWSIPALGLAFTVTVAVSVQMPLSNMK